MNYLKTTLFATFALGVTAFISCGPKEETVAVTGVEITSVPDPLTLAVGATGKAEVTVLPSDATDKSYELSVAPEGVVTIATDGTVTAVAPGTATITATAANGIKGTCSVTVAKFYTGTYTVASESDEDYFVWPDATIAFIVDPDETSADMKMIRVKFADGMSEMDIIVPGITVTKTDEGFSISGEGIIPTMGGRPFEQFVMTDFTGTVTEEEMSWEMMCGTFPLTFEGTATE